MSRLPRVTGKEVAMALEYGGYVLVRVRGSHHYFRKTGHGGLVCVPVHSGEMLAPKTLKTILEQADLTVDEFLGLLHG